MTDTPFTPREEDEALAAEYVLGLPDLAERLGIEARIKACLLYTSDAADE